MAATPKSRKTSRTKSTVAKTYPLLNIHRVLTGNGLLPTTEDLGLNANPPVKRLEVLTPDLDGSWYDEGFDTSYIFDESGRTITFRELYKDAAGETHYSATYDSEGRPQTVELYYATPNQDPMREEQGMESTYKFTWDGDRITNISEQTTSVWGKPVKWPVYNYAVSYYPSGIIKNITCKENPKVYVNFNKYGQLSTFSLYENVWDHRKMWFTLSPVTEDYSIQGPKDYYGYRDVTDVTIDTKTDANGNWIEKLWRYPDFEGEDGVKRKLLYY